MKEKKVVKKKVVPGIRITPSIKKAVNACIRGALTYEKLTGRKMGITGEVGEVLGCKMLNLLLAEDPLTAGYDAIDEKTRSRYQIKTRRVNHEKGRIGTFSSHSFDYAVLVILNFDYSVDSIWKMEQRQLDLILKKSPKRNPHYRDFLKYAERIGSFK